MTKLFKTNDGCEFDTYDAAKDHEDSVEYKEYQEYFKIKNMTQKELEVEIINDMINRGNNILKELGVDDELIPWV